MKCSGAGTRTKAIPVDLGALKLTRHAKFREALDNAVQMMKRKSRASSVIFFFPVQPPNRVRLAPYQMSEPTGYAAFEFPAFNMLVCPQKNHVNHK
jgi:hypothetical protein